MFYNYFKTAWRNIFNNKFYAAINIGGLTIGLVVGLFILLWVQDELSFDRFNKQAKNIYKIGIVGGSGSTRQIFSSIIAPAATYAKNELPEVKDAVRIKFLGKAPLQYKDKTFWEDGFAFTDPSFFKVFDLNLVRGNNSKPFADNSAVVITQTLAKKYFGSEDPIGKLVVLGNNQTFRVSGVMVDAPKNSSINCNILMPLSLFNNLAYVQGTVNYNGTGRLPSMDADWVDFTFETYLLLKPNANIARLEKELQHIHERQRPEDAPCPYVAQPLLNVHLYRADGGDGGIGTVSMFGMVALFILVIASINYVNLSTARAMLRAKEVSMRKIIGADKIHLFLQFIVDTGLLFLIATILSIGLMYLLLPYYNSFSGKQLTLSITNYHIWIWIGVALIGTLAASAIYPALMLSSFDPLKALKGKITSGLSKSSFRRVLVVIQFSISIILIIGTLIISNQLKYIQSKNLGYDKDNVLTFTMRNNMISHFDAIKDDLLKQPGIKEVTRGGNIIDNPSWTGDNDWEGKPAKSNLLFHPISIDQSFIPFFNIKVLQGKNFSGAIADSLHFIVNEAAIKAMDLKDPIGKRMRFWSLRGNITGVVKDFHFSSFHKKIEPAVFIYNPGNAAWQVYVKTSGKEAQKAINAVKQVWKQYNNQVPLQYTFLDESFNQLYKADQRTGSLFNLFAAVTILLSCLGLFGLATYTAQVRTTEIGIRKVLGATVIKIIQLLATEFMLLILVSLLVAVPIAWVVMNRWLSDYAYRTTIQWWVFALAGVSAITIAFITISFQSVRAAMANPIKSIRNN